MRSLKSGSLWITETHKIFMELTLNSIHTVDVAKIRDPDKRFVA